MSSVWPNGEREAGGGPLAGIYIPYSVEQPGPCPGCSDNGCLDGMNVRLRDAALEAWRPGRLGISSHAKHTASAITTTTRPTSHVVPVLAFNVAEQAFVHDAMKDLARGLSLGAESRQQTRHLATWTCLLLLPTSARSPIHCHYSNKPFVSLLQLLVRQ
jgi:hypothetical protein